MSRVASAASAAASIAASSPVRGSSIAGSVTNGRIAVSSSRISSITGRSRQELKTTGMNFAVPRSDMLRSASSRRRAATPARRTELLPTPLAAYRIVSRAARRLPMISVRSDSRPKKTSA